MADSSHPPVGAAAAPENRSNSVSPVSSLTTSPRAARFAEATSVQSPVEANGTSKSPFADPSTQQKATPPDVSDFGFGYVNTSDPTQYAPHHQAPASPLKSPFKVPGTPGRTLDPLSPTFKEEFYVEKHEQKADKENAKDVKIKLRVRLAKVFLRFVNFGCSLIVLAILGTTLSIFNATKSLPSRNNLPAWAEGTNPWPQWVLLAVSCVSLIACLMVFYGYWRGGHKLAQKYAVYYSILSIGFFGFNLIMWVVAAAVYQSSKANGNSQDLWGWSCSKNLREELFQNDIDYALMCRLQDWGLVCAIIEIVLEVVVILIYVVVIYRFFTKHRLTKVMDQRGQARSELHLAQFRMQSAPNSPAPPGFGYGYPPQTPKSPWVAASPAMFPMKTMDPYSAAENGQAQPQLQPQTQTQTQEPGSGSTIQYATPRSPTKPQPTFQLQQPPPARAHQSPKSEQGQWSAPAPAPAGGPVVVPGQAVTQGPFVPAAAPSPSMGPAYQPMSPPPGGQQFASIIGPTVGETPGTAPRAQ